MKAVSWMHTADLHLGKPLEHWRGSKEEYMLRKEEYRQTFQRIIQLVKEREIPFLFIAGDFLEHGYVSRSLWDFIQEQLEQIPNTAIFISPGNHDPYRIDSVYRKEKWPDHVHIFGTEWETHTANNLQIVGRGFADFHDKEPSLPSVNDAARKIMIVHGELCAKPKKSDYFPICEQSLAALELNYVAMGHIHQSYQRTLSNERETIVRYAGSPEALSWKETKGRTVTIGHLHDHTVELELIPIHTKTYEKHEIELQGVVSKEQVLAELSTQLQAYSPDSYHLIRLTGRIAPGWNFAEEISWIVYEMYQQGFGHVYLEEQLLPDFDLDYLRKQSNFTGRFIDMMEKRLNESEEDAKERVRAALYKGLEAIYARETS